MSWVITLFSSNYVRREGSWWGKDFLKGLMSYITSPTVTLSSLAGDRDPAPRKASGMSAPRNLETMKQTQR